MRLDQGIIDLLNYSFISRVKDTSVKANIRPAVDSTYNLGSNERRFNYVYADNIVASTFLGDVSGNADTVDSYHAYATPTANGLLALDSSLHFPNTVYPDALLTDGTRSLTGNLAVSAGVTIDGIDISAHAADGDIHADHTTVIITGGAGLTGGGDITTSRTLDVGAGDGIDVAADSISVDVTDLLAVSQGITEDGSNNLILAFSGSPVTLTANLANGAGSSSYAARTDHAHDITHTADATGISVATLLSATSAGYLTLNRLGVGVTPSYTLHVQNTASSQLRLQYDATHTASFFVDSGGSLSLNLTGNLAVRNTVADTDLFVYLRSDTSSFIYIVSDYDNDTEAQSGILFNDGSTSRWGLWKGTNTNFQLYDYAETAYILSIAPSASILWTPATAGVFEIRKGGEQLRLAYDGTYYTQFIVNSSGVLTIDAVGDAVVFQTNNKIGSVDFTSQSVGWEVTYDGNADFRYIYADELRVKAFTAEIYSALAGALIITKSRATLNREFLIPLGYRDIVGVDQASDYFSIGGDHTAMIDTTVIVADSTGNNGSYTVASVSYDSGNNETDIYVNEEIPSATVDGTIRGAGRLIYVRDHEGFEGYDVFVDGDYIRLRVIDMSGGGLVVADVWGRVYNHVDDGGGEQHWTFYPLDDGGVAGSALYEGSILLDYGADGDGTWEVTVLDYGNSPYSQVTTWATDPSVQANHTVWVRTGNLDGIGTLTEQYGIWMGQGTDENNDSQIIMSNLGARIINTDLYIRASGTNRVIASTSGYISAGISAPTTFGTGVGFWAGIDATYAKIMIGNTAGNWLSYDSNTGYLDVKSGANTYGRWDAGTITLGLATGTGGRAVLSSTGVFLYGNNANTVAIQSTGDVRVGRNNSGDAYMEWDANGGTSGGGRLNFRKTASVQLYVDDDGALYSGSRTVKFDSNGISIDAPASVYGAASAFKFYDSFGGNLLGGLYGRWVSATPNANYLHLYAEPISGFGSTVDIEAACTSSAGSYAQGTLHANYNSGAQMAQVSVYANATTATVTITGLTGISFLGDMKTNYGLTVGDSSQNPANGEIFASGDVVMGGGLMVGSTSYTTDVTNGHIWFNDSGLRIYDSGSNYLRIYNSYGTADIGCSSINFLYIGTSTQGVNIGGVLYVNGNIVSGSTGVYASNAGSVSNAVHIWKEGTNGRMDIVHTAYSDLWINYGGNGAASRKVLIGNGNAGYGDIDADNFNNISTRASKRNIRSLKGDLSRTTALDTVDALEPVAYEMVNGGHGRAKMGLIAEEVVDIVPQVVALDYQTGLPSGIDYGQLVPLLIEAIKELKEEVRRLS